MNVGSNGWCITGAYSLKGVARRVNITNFLMYHGNGFLSRGFTDWRQILHGGSAPPRTGLLPSWGIVPGMADFSGSTGDHMAGYASC